MAELLFEGGPLAGQRLNVADHVRIYLAPELIVEPGWEWSWEVGGFVWSDPDSAPPLVDSAPASYRNVTYRREGDVFRMEDT